MLESIESLENWLKGELVTKTNDSLDILQNIVVNLGRQGSTIHLLNMFLQNPLLLETCASQSYVHSNGFDKIVLLTSNKPQFKLRLHIWWPNPTHITKENIHNHRWDFATRLLTGSYHFEEYILDEGGEIKHEYHYESPKGRDNYALRLVGPQGLMRIFSCRMHAGTSYALSHHHIHRVINDSQTVTSSLMLQSSDISFSTRVFADEVIENSENIDASPISVPVLQEKLTAMIQILRG